MNAGAFWIALAALLVLAGIAVGTMVLILRIQRRDIMDDAQMDSWYVELWHIRLGYRIELRFDGVCVLGRASLCENACVPVEMDPTISREHCMLYEQEDILWAWNMSMVNPAAINGHRLNQPMQLKCGDRIELGNSVFLVTRIEQI